MCEVLDRVPRWLLPGRGQTVLCAVSGGLDSMCLLHLLADWCGRRQGRVVAAHFNHRLRGADSDRDQAFVESWCAARGIDVVCGSGDAAALAQEESLSLEEAARDLRYAFLRREAEKLGGVRIYTAHHADDNAETILFHLIRGTGVAGLAGMAYQHDGIYRPLLDLTRQELAQYAAAHEIPHVEDASNADPDAAARNFLRLQVMPLLRKVNPRAAEHIAGTAARLAEMDAGLSDLTERYLCRASVQPGRVTISLADLAEVPDFLRPQVLLGLFDLLEVGRKDIGAVHLEALERLCASHGNDARISLPHGVTARLSDSRLVLETSPAPLSRTELVKNRPLFWGDYTVTLLDRREGPGLALRPRRQEERMSLTVGPCQAGDRLTLPGERGGRTVKRLCLDRHITLAERDRLPAVYLGDRLAAVWGLGVDVEFAPEGEPCRFIQIMKKTEENHHEK